MRDELKKSLLVTAPVPILGLGLVAPLLSGAPLLTNALLGGIAAVSLIITGAGLAALGLRMPANVRSGVSVFIAGSVLTIAKIAVSALLNVKNVPVETLAPLLFTATVIAATTEAYAVKRKSAAVLFDGMGIGLCFTLLLCACGALRDAGGALFASTCGVFFIAALVVLGIAHRWQRTTKGAS